MVYRVQVTVQFELEVLVDDVEQAAMLGYQEIERLLERQSAGSVEGSPGRAVSVYYQIAETVHVSQKVDEA